MRPGEVDTLAIRRPVQKGWRRFKPIRCSICALHIWLRPIALVEPVEAPEPRHEWVLCSYCHKALINEVQRAALSSPVRLRVAVGLLAAERSPYGYYMSQQRAFQREFSWFVWAMVVFIVFHMGIFVLLLAVPR